MVKIKSKTLIALSLLVFVFLLGFSFSVQAYALRQQELNSPVSQYLRENYGVNSIEEYQAKIEQEIWLNYSKQMEALASEHPELNLPQSYIQAGTSTYQPPTLKSELPFYVVVLGEPVVSLQVFSLSGLGLLGLAAVPPVKKRKQLRQALILGIVVLCVFSVGYFVGLTVAQTGTITIEPNSFQTETSYIIFTDGTTIKARNGKTGAIDYSGTDASTVIQSAINALGSTGGKIFIKRGSYTLSAPLSVSLGSNDVIIEGESATTTGFYRNFGGTDFMLNVTGNVNGIGMFGLHNILLNSLYNSLNNPALNLESSGSLHRWSIENVMVYYGLPALRLAGFVWLSDFHFPRIYISEGYGYSWTGTKAIILFEQAGYSDRPKINVVKARINVYASTSNPVDYAVYVNGGYNVFEELEVDSGYYNQSCLCFVAWSNHVKHYRGQDIGATANTKANVYFSGSNCFANSVEGLISTVSKNVEFDNGAYRNYVKMNAFGSGAVIDATGAGIDNMVEFMPPHLSSGTTFTLTHTGAPVIYRGYGVENSGTVYPANNGTVITHGLAGIPTTITLTLNSRRNFATGCYLLDPTVIATSSTTFTIELLYYNVTASAYYAVTPSVYNATIYWNVQYNP
jgi:hypothetical protein